MCRKEGNIFVSIFSNSYLWHCGLYFIIIKIYCFFLRQNSPFFLQKFPWQLLRETLSLRNGPSTHYPCGASEKKMKSCNKLWHWFQYLFFCTIVFSIIPVPLFSVSLFCHLPLSAAYALAWSQPSCSLTFCEQKSQRFAISKYAINVKKQTNKYNRVKFCQFCKYAANQDEKSEANMGRVLNWRVSESMYIWNIYEWGTDLMLQTPELYLFRNKNWPMLMSIIKVNGHYWTKVSSNPKQI